MKGKLTLKQMCLSSMIRYNRAKLMEAGFSGPRLAQYSSGARVPDYDAAKQMAKICKSSVKDLPYHRLVL